MSTSRIQTMVQLNEELVTLLDQRASQLGVSRSRLIRDAIEAFLEPDRSAAIDREIIDGYKRMPQGGSFDVDEWGDLGAMMSALTVDQMRYLDEEERAEGHEPW